jgi:DNA-binding transcriptional LysR family regulator
MRAFVAVAKTGSFGAAAQKLDLVPSVITKRVTQLERIVDTTLFHRSTRKVVLSADGEHHLERIIGAIATHDQALTELRKEATVAALTASRVLAAFKHRGEPTVERQNRSNLYQSDSQGNQPHPNPDRELYVPELPY